MHTKQFSLSNNKLYTQNHNSWYFDTLKLKFKISFTSRHYISLWNKFVISSSDKARPYTFFVLNTNAFFSVYNTTAYQCNVYTPCKKETTQIMFKYLENKKNHHFPLELLLKYHSLVVKVLQNIVINLGNGFAFTQIKLQLYCQLYILSIKGIKSLPQVENIFLRTIQSILHICLHHLATWYIIMIECFVTEETEKTKHNITFICLFCF